MRLLPTAFAAAAAISLACCAGSARAKGSDALQKQWCELRPQRSTTANATEFRADGRRTCPQAFTAHLLKVQDGTEYGACFLEIDPEQAALAASTQKGFHADDCRQICHENGADLPVLPSVEVENYVYDLMTDPRKERSHPPTRMPWLAVIVNRTVGDWTSIVDGSLLRYTNWKEGSPHSTVPSDSWRPCGEQSCVALTTLSSPRGWSDVPCTWELGCLCQVPNATREGAVMYAGLLPYDEPLMRSTAPFMALYIVSMMLTAGAIVAAAYLQDGNSSASDTAKIVTQSQTSLKAKMTAIVEEKHEEREKFYERLVDENALFLCFLDDEEEEMYMKVARDEGLKGIHLLMTLVMPGLFLAAVTWALIVNESVHRITEVIIGENREAELSSRPFYLVCLGEILLLVCLGKALVRRVVDAELFPYVAFACGVLIFIVLWSFMTILVSYGSLIGKAPFDGLVRTWSVVLLFAFPKYLHLPLSFTIALIVLVAVATESFLATMYSFYEYKCACYELASRDLPKVSYMCQSHRKARLTSRMQPLFATGSCPCR